MAVINGAGDGGASFGINSIGVSDWEQPLFIDRAKQSRGWSRPSSVPMPLENLDSLGRLVSLPAGDTSAWFFLSSNQNTLGHVTPADFSGRFRLSFTGTATVSLANAGTNITQIDSNTFEFDSDWNDNKWFVFSSITGPIEVSCVKTTNLAAHAAGDIWEPAYLDSLPSGGCYRLMNYMRTNNSTVVAVSDYPVAESQTWNRVPWEAMVDLCNRKNYDAWISIPHLANDAFVQAICEYFRDNLSPSLKLRLELSNEIWNTGVFNHGAYFRGLAESVWGVPNGFANGIFLAYAGKRFVECVNIAETVFSAAPARLIPVIGGQAASTAATIGMCDATQWQTSEPGSYVRPSTKAKEISIAPYINWVGSATDRGNEIAAALGISYAAGVQAVKDMIPASLSQANGWIDNHVVVSAARGCRLTMYEYNNHYDLQATSASALYSGGAPIAGARDAFVEATYSSEMAAAQDDLRDYFKSQNGSLMCLYRELGRSGTSGTWGARTWVGHNSPIWNALLAWHAANPRWYSQ